MHNKFHTKAGGNLCIGFVEGGVFHGVDVQDGDWWDFNTNPVIGGIFELRFFWESSEICGFLISGIGEFVNMKVDS